METNAWVIEYYDEEHKVWSDQYTFAKVYMFPTEPFKLNLFSGCLGELQAKAMMHTLCKNWLDTAPAKIYKSKSIKMFLKKYRLVEKNSNVIEQIYQKGWSHSYSHTLMENTLDKETIND